MAEAGQTAEPEPPANRAWIAVETIGATALALYLSLRFGSPLVWLLIPVVMIVTRGESSSDYGFDVRFRPPSWTTHLVLGGSLLLLYGVLHAWFAHTVLGLSLRPPPADLVGLRLGLVLVEEFLVIGIPEEAFFRGYLQTRWNTAFGRPWRLLGAKVGPGYLFQATVFALCHLATGDWTRLRVFFFALLAGWLRERSQSIAGPAAYHAIANVWYRILTSIFR